MARCLLEALENESYALIQERVWGDAIMDARQKEFFPEGEIDFYIRKRDEAVADVIEARKEIKRFLEEIMEG